MSPSSPTPGSSAIEYGRFLPGVVLDGRYRVVGLLGKGGMGEVYRADDLRLGQTVALKFLPQQLEQRPEALQHLLDEVRLARQVTHPNVCRVHDIGEFEGQTFLSMEYVDGEDLESLLQRIGRLPADKAMEIARQMCAGLAKAHERGVLHRDLKPANVMIDGRGQARITDFGLAGAIAEGDAEDGIVGTPGYLAPEVLTGRGASVRSDVYGLGLVLYELFTGRHPFRTDDSSELIRRQVEEEPPPLSRFVPDIDADVERVILQCLEKDPAKRVASALAVSAAMSRGDPIAAMIAAGETPTPEMIADAGASGGVRPWVAASLASIALAGVWLVALCNRDTLLSDLNELPLAPAVLEHRARGILDRLGFADDVGSTAAGLVHDWGGQRYMEIAGGGHESWQGLNDTRATFVSYWFRTSPETLDTDQSFGQVRYDNPPVSAGGMTRLLLDPQGRLVRLRAVPRGLSSLSGDPEEPDWSLLFEAAGLDIAAFTAVQQGSINPGLASDVRRIWAGADPDTPAFRLLVGGAAFDGKPVYFGVTWHWAQGAAPAAEPDVEERRELSQWLERVSWDIAQFIIGLVLVVGVFLARRNIRSGRSDRRGATRLALYIFAIRLGTWLMVADHRADLASEWDLLLQTVKESLFYAVFLWVLYVALEPTVRRTWPRCLASWSRLLAGRWRDPLVGRDILIGAACAGVTALIVRGYVRASMLFGETPRPQRFDLDTFFGLDHLVGEFLIRHADAAFTAMAIFLVLSILNVMLRWRWLAVGALGALAVLAAPMPVLIGDPAWDVPMRFLMAAVMIFVALRFGLLAFAVAASVGEVLDQLPVTIDLADWNGSATWFMTVALGAIVAFGYSTATRAGSAVPVRE